MMDVPAVDTVIAAMKSEAADAIAYDGVIPQSMAIMVES